MVKEKSIFNKWYYYVAVALFFFYYTSRQYGFLALELMDVFKGGDIIQWSTYVTLSLGFSFLAMWILFKIIQKVKKRLTKAKSI